MLPLLRLVRCPLDDSTLAADQWNMPLDLLLLANGVKDICDVEIIDGTLYGIEEVCRRLASPATCVAFTYTALSSNHLGKLTTASKRNGSLVVVGGQAAVGSANSLIRQSSVDVICIGDGLPFIIALAKQIAGGNINTAHLPNALVRHEDGTIITTETVTEDIWSQTIPSRKIATVDPKSYINRYPFTNTLINMGGSRATNIYSKRGCNYFCSFCARQDKKIRVRNPEIVAAEISQLVSDYEVDYILDMSDTWIDIEWSKRFRKEKHKYGVDDIPLMVFADSRHISAPACEIMRHCKVESVLLGIESGSERILSLNDKATTRGKILDSVNHLVQAGIKVSCSFVFGLLGEDQSSIDDTLSLSESLSKLPGVLCYGNVIIPLMGSKLWNSTFTTDKQWPSFITNPFHYNLALVRKKYVENGTNIKSVDTLEMACKTLLDQSGLGVIEYAR